MNFIIKRIQKIKRFFLILIANKNNKNIDNNGVTAIVNQGYLHIERAIEYVNYFKLDNSGFILDIGGGLGSPALMFAKKFASSKIIVFEPIVSTYDYLLYKLKDYKNVTIINKAVGNEEKEISINITANITSSSLLDIESNIDCDLFEKTLEKQSSQNVQLTKLSKFLGKDDKVNILKIDAQGYELEVLKGLEQKISNVSIIIIELANHHFYKDSPQYFEIDEYLRKNFFVLYDILPAIIRNYKLYEWDSLYVNKNILN